MLKIKEVEMDKHRAIPEGYMTVGTLAKKMGITVRTLHHYDKAGLLSPSGESEGGYRLYSDKDMVRLHQILTMKYLGFSLDDIKNRLISLDTPEEVAATLTEHAVAIRKKLESLEASLKAIEALKDEVIQMQSVDFQKYAYIIESLQMKNEHYWVIKHFDDELLNHATTHDKDSASKISSELARLTKEAERLQKKGALPESDEGQLLAQGYWDMLMAFSKGDVGLISKLARIHEKDGEVFDKLPASPFIGEALWIYLRSEEAKTELVSDYEIFNNGEASND